MDLDFQEVIMNYFGHKKLCDLLQLVKSSDLTKVSGSKIVKMILNGD